MIALLAALLLAQAPAPEGTRPGPPPATPGAGSERRGDAPRQGDAPKQDAAGKRATPDEAKGAGGRRKPDRKPTDEEVIRELDLLERLPLLERLELFDPGGDAAARKR